MFCLSESKPKIKAKKEKTQEEKTFRKRAKYFVAVQLFAVVLCVMDGFDSLEVNLDDDENLS